MFEEENLHKPTEKPVSQDPRVGNLLETLNSQRSPEQLNVPRIKLYRAITGRGKSVDGSWRFEGTQQDRLLKYGLFESNTSYAQFSETTSDASYDRRVPGLPVFTTPEEAINWIERKSFIDKPTIAVLDIPISALTGEGRVTKLMRNTLDRNVPDWEVTIEQLESQNIRGECYLRGINPNNPSVPDSIREYEVLVQPKELKPDGSINFDSGFEVVENK